MSSWHPDRVVTVIGTQIFAPIAYLLDRMLARPFRNSDPVSSNYHEGGYAASIILLLAVVVESMVARDRHFNKKAVGKQGLPVPEYMKEVHRFRSYQRLSELFVLRDAIAHNHVWLLNYLWSEGKRRKLTSAVRTTWSGNRRLEKRLNPNTFRTKVLRANVIPDRMDRKDVYAALAVSLSVLAVLAKRGANPVTVTNSIVGFKGQLVPFSVLQDKVADAL
jgi:hypothetical protein